MSLGGPPLCHRPYSRSSSVPSALRRARRWRSFPSPLLTIFEDEADEEMAVTEEEIIISPPSALTSDGLVTLENVPLISNTSLFASTMSPSHAGVVEALPAVTGLL